MRYGPAVRLMSRNRHCRSARKAGRTWLSESIIMTIKPPSRLPRLLSIPHVAEHLGVCTKTVRRLIQSGELLATRVGRAIRVTETDLGAYLARGRSHVH